MIYLKDIFSTLLPFQALSNIDIHIIINTFVTFAQNTSISIL
jgi:hypothetical protein